MVQITMIEGRSSAQREAMAREVTDAISRTLGAPAKSIRILVTETPADQWYIGGEPSRPRTPANPQDQVSPIIARAALGEATP
jgi:4-oxalocrotonate tautomerase